MSKIISVVSGKGGVGKTTSVANIGLGLSELGFKVLVIDFDIGQRNLDMILGLENRVIYDLIDVLDGKISYKDAILFGKNNLNFLAASQTKDKSFLKSEKIKILLDELRGEYDYIILDSPAGIESGFEHSVEFCTEAIVVVNPEVSSIRDSDKAIGIIDSKSYLAKQGKDIKKHILVTRVNKNKINSGRMLSLDDIHDILGLPILGYIPEDKSIIEASNSGIPVILNQSLESGKAYLEISKQIAGYKTSNKFRLIDSENGFLYRIFGKVKEIF